MTKKTPTSPPFECSEDTENQFDTKRMMIREGANDTDLKDIRKVVSRSIRKDKRQHRAKMVSKDLDIRSRWLGIKNSNQNIIQHLTTTKLKKVNTSNYMIEHERQQNALAENNGENLAKNRKT